MKFFKSSATYALVAILALLTGYFAYHRFAEDGSRKDHDVIDFESTVLLPKPRSLEQFSLVDANGNAFHTENFSGKWNLLFFGFTHCPDICPTTLHSLAQVKQELERAGLWQHFRVFLVTVDPERDTASIMRNYLDFFDQEFNGIGGNPEEVAKLARSLGAIYVKTATDSSGNYQVDHSAAIVLVNDQSQYAGAIRAPHQIERIVQDLSELANHYPTTETVLNTVVSDATTPEQDSGPSDGVRASAIEEQIKFTNAWIRLAPASSEALAGYVDIHNLSQQDIRIKDVDSDAFDSVMLHETRTVDGMSRMHHLDELFVPAKEIVRLQPMGLHLMLMQPERALSKGENATIIFTNDDGGSIEVVFEIQMQAPKQALRQ